MNTNFKIKLSGNWRLQSSEKVNFPGSEISTEKDISSDWFPAHVPSTVLATLVENSIYKEPYFGKNLEDIPSELFKVPWWYCTDFDLSDEQAEKTVILSLDGINYKANVWLNGKLIADKNTINGAFRRTKLHISNNIKSGRNILTIEVIPPMPGDFSIGYVDWNVYPPDNNMGIFRDISLHFNNGVSIDNPFVETKVDLDTLKSAELKILAELSNYSDQNISGLLKCKIGSATLEKHLSIPGNGKFAEEFTIKDFPELKIANPKLWWPNNLGEPDLHKLELSFEIDNRISDFRKLTYGIREVEDYLTDEGHRGFKINGKKVLIKSGGWSDDLLLQDTHESLENQIAYVKHMNLNSIRLEGFWGKDHKLYDLCDQNGILMMAGWTCHWEHEQYLGKPIDPLYGGIIEPDEIELMAQSWEDQILWLRHHPSIFVWNVGSDMIPHPDLEREYIKTFNKYDTTRPYLNSTGGVGSEQGIITEVEVISEISGSSCVKMLGPYAYTPPVYWFTNKHLGGAYGFNTETCPGANVPPLESIKKMIPADHLWPIDDVWEYHCGKNDFKTLDRITKAIDERYGKASGVADFAFKAQLLNYELMRPMFEAFQVNKSIATGIVQWMLNSALPNMYWQLYDSYLMPNGAFYATKKACEPLHLLYDYGNQSIHLVNDHFYDIADHQAQIRILDINSTEVFNKVVDIGCAAESSSLILNLPDLKNITTTYFLDLRLIDQHKNQIGNNFYWLSKKQDVLDYEAEFEDWPFYTPTSEYADYKQLNSLEPIRLNTNFRIKSKNDKLNIEVEINNPDEKIAFFIDLNISGEKSGNTVLPVFWDDNYFSLLPGETRKIKVSIPTKYLKNDKPVLKVSGWNIEQQNFKLK